MDGTMGTRRCSGSVFIASEHYNGNEPICQGVPHNIHINATPVFNLHVWIGGTYNEQKRIGFTKALIVSAIMTVSSYALLTPNKQYI